MGNKNVLFVCQYFYPEKISSGILPYELACELSKNGYKVKALVGFPHEYNDVNDIKKEESVNGISIRRIKYPLFKRSNILGRLLNYFGFCLTVLLNFREFKDIHYCISYTNPPFLPPIIAWFSKKYKFKFVFEIYDLYPDTAIKAGVLNENSIMTKIFNHSTNYALKNCWKIVALARECKDYLVQYKDINEYKVEVIPNWYKEVDHKSKLNIITDKLTIIYGGNMGVMQDIDTIKELILSLKDDKRFEFVFAGHGSKKIMLEKVIQDYSIRNCKMYDFLPKDEYDQLLEKANFAIVSLENFGIGLGSPSKYYGYLALGIPIIAIIDETSDIAKDILEYKNGFFVHNGDYISIINNLDILFQNSEELNNMSNQSKKIFNDKYTLTKSAYKYIKLMEENSNESI